MPAYRSSDGDQVQALQIKTVRDLMGGAALVPEDDSYGVITADFRWIEAQNPAPGGYVVRHAVDSWTFATAAVFAAAYTPVATGQQHTIGTRDGVRIARQMHGADGLRSRICGIERALTGTQPPD
jgi:hypothetical protein